MKQGGEPSVEEILASIKQVIARDHRAGPAIEQPRREPAAPAEAAQSPATAAPDDVLDLVDTIAVEDSEPEPTAPLLTENTRVAMRESLAALAAISGPGATPQIVRSGETSVESLVRELLRPALSEWLDQNLPSLVERLVAAEIARIVGKKT